MNIKIDIDTIRTVLNMSAEELAQKLNVSYKTIVSWQDGTNELTEDNMNKLYNFAYRQNYRINESKERFFKEEYEHNDNVVLFHGSKYGLSKEISVENSKIHHDFGKGFYCGENLIQASSFVSNFTMSKVYAYTFQESSELKKTKLSLDRTWLLLVGYHKGLLKEYENHPLIQKLLKKIEDVDYIIAPITDNRVTDLINNFVHKMITDAQCCHCIAELNLGNQYVFLSNKAIKKLEALDTFFLCEEERKNSVNIRRNQMLNFANKVDVAMIKYRGKGQYIDEVFA